jgi:hypothetical protein
VISSGNKKIFHPLRHLAINKSDQVGPEILCRCHQSGRESLYLHASEEIWEQSTKNAYPSVRRDRGKMVIELLDMESEEFGKIMSRRTMPEKT